MFRFRHPDTDMRKVPPKEEYHMRLLILGGSGFVSGTLCRMAKEAGHEVWAVTRGQREMPEGIHTLCADRNDLDSLRKQLKTAGGHFDAALDCICFNADQARADLALLPEVTGRLVVISTDSVYHPYHKQVPQNEDAPCFLEDGGYGCNKRKMEEVFLEDAGKHLHVTLFRPGHIFGAGSQLGCYPEHTRQKDLLFHMKADKPLRLVDGGSFLFQPIYSEDLCRVMLECIPNEKTFDRVFCIGGPDMLSNARYFEILGELIGHPARIESIPLPGYLEAHPEYSGHLCQRVYDLTRLRETGIRLPDTPFREGLEKQVRWLEALK